MVARIALLERPKLRSLARSLKIATPNIHDSQEHRATGVALNGKPSDLVVVASEKADFIADRIAAGVPAPERELRRLARSLREIAVAMGSKLTRVDEARLDPGPERFDERDWPLRRIDPSLR